MEIKREAPEKTLLEESEVVEGYEIFEWTLPEAAKAMRAWGQLTKKALGIEEGKEIKIEELPSGLDLVAAFMDQDEVYTILAAGLRKSIEEAKKVPAKKVMILFSAILKLNWDFFVKVPQMMGKILLPETE